ncbi:hypothetical protein OG604_02090 [Streptomyces sp. NBC_01231]|nr:hypothetical protein OG604_02090 [Streptomyces sp. NBC_01231]
MFQRTTTAVAGRHTSCGGTMASCCSVIRHQRAVQEALLVRAEQPATTPPRCPYDAAPLRTRQPLPMTAQGWCGASCKYQPWAAMHSLVHSVSRR